MTTFSPCLWGYAVRLTKYSMPHVIVEGPASLERLYQEFTPFSREEHGTILKVREAFLNTLKTKVLLDCVVVEDRVPLTFYLEVIQREGGITVHIDPLTDPERTNGVKRLIALIGQRLKSHNPACRYGKHNLTGFLIEE